MTPKILIVEDDFIASDEMQDRLRRMGYPDLYSAFQGEEAVQQAADLRPDLILMDIHLGTGIDGIEAAGRIRQNQAVPIIYLTAYDNDAVLKRAKITEPYAYVLKPFDERELHVAIEIALHKHDSEQRLHHALQESRQREREIAELLEATHAVLGVGEFEATAQIIFNACKRTIGAKAGYVALLSPDGENNDLLFLDDGGLPCTVDPDLPMPVRGLRAEAYRTGRVVYENDFMRSEWAHFMPEGHVTLPNVLFAPLNLDGKTVGVLGISNKDSDFTERDARLATAFGEYAAIALWNSKTLETLHAQNEQLLQLNATKDTFFSIIAHDLKNPFMGIVAGAEMLKDRVPANSDDGFGVNVAAELHSAAQRLYKLLENLLTWARVQQGRIPFEPWPVALSTAVKYTLQMLKDTAARKQITLDAPLEPGIMVYADGDMLAAILRNLVSNALKFTPPGGRVTVAARPADDGMVEVSVADTGVGMQADKMARLFRAGESRLSSPGTEGEKGTGLGLILCREFVERHGGRIWVDSEEGRGSTFVFTLPANR